MASNRLSRRAQRGSAMVEFTLLTPLLVALFLGVISFGYDFYTYNRLEDAVRGAARFVTTANQSYDVYNGGDPALSCGGSSTTCNVPLDQSQSQLATLAANFAVYGSPDAGTDPLIEGLATSQVAVSVDVKNNRPQNIWVTINGYVLRTPLGAITLQNKPAAVFPFTGNYAIAP